MAFSISLYHAYYTIVMTDRRFIGELTLPARAVDQYRCTLLPQRHSLKMHYWYVSTLFLQVARKQRTVAQKNIIFKSTYLLQKAIKEAHSNDMHSKETTINREVALAIQNYIALAISTSHLSQIDITMTIPLNVRPHCPDTKSWIDPGPG